MSDTRPLVVLADAASVRCATGEAATLIGGRAYQQDAFVCSAGLHAVADGMGGHAGGDVAARAALDTIVDRLSGPVTVDEIHASFAAANDAVCAIPFNDHRPPGTTLVAAAAHRDGDRVVVASIGDSRAYLVAGGELRQITVDHEDPYGALTACLGAHGARFFHVDVFEVRAGDGASLLLASDGLFGHVDDDVLAEVLAAGGVNGLVEFCAASSRDNVTAALVDIDALARTARSR